jgi:hypothetical protein
MPIYIFEHPKTKKQIELIQGMNEKHEYVDGKGIKWNRIFSKPNAAVDTEIDPFSYTDFVNKTNNKKGTVGDLWDKSAELSDKRAKKVGKDPVKAKAITDYRKKCQGRLHPHE